jgi:hypothetical protein
MKRSGIREDLQYRKHTPDSVSLHPGYMAGLFFYLDDFDTIP